MLESLAEKIQGTLKKLRGKGKLNARDVDAAMKEVRMSLLEADVNYRVVKDFVARIHERASGAEVMESLTPGQQVVKIVHEELQELMGGTGKGLEEAAEPPTVVMLVGLQGSGKTTTCGKLGRWLASRGHRPLLVAADLQRPAAVKQLQVIGEQVEVPVFAAEEAGDPVRLVDDALQHCRARGQDFLLVDTAGRWHVDEDLMTSLREMKEILHPHHVLLTVDAMTGQEAVNVAQSFQEYLSLSGIILTKLDGDTRGGAALSIRQVTGCPVLFTGTGEKLDELEYFHPDRLASRILGMGDVLTLIEKAEAAVDRQDAQKMEEKLRAGDFNFEDFLEQMDQIRHMGPLDQLVGLLPGMGRVKGLQNMVPDEKDLERIKAIISSMTREERRHPSIIDGSRKRRIARGSGTTVQDINRLLKQFQQSRKMMRSLQQMEKRGKSPGLPFTPS